MIKVGYLVSYDYNMLLISLKRVYNFVDRIYLAVDKGRKTWAGNIFEIPEPFFDQIKEFDKSNKIKFYFDNFYIQELTPMQCETRERNLLAKKMGKGWIMQLDVDEYIYDFEKLAKYLKRYWFLTIFPKLIPLVFEGNWITLYKKIPEGYIYIENNEHFPFITNIPDYDFARNNSRAMSFFINVKTVHQSWARSEDEIHQKISNWGHKDDFDTQKYFNLWNNLNVTNYKDYKNIHPLVPSVWSELHFLPATSIDDFINKYSDKNEQKLVPLDLKNMIKSFIYKLFFGTKQSSKT